MAAKPPGKIPEKLFFKIGEAADLVGVESHVLRFWESEFPQIKPSRVGSRQRLYRQKDIETFQQIKHLLYEERFTIEGTRKRLTKSGSIQPPPLPSTESPAVAPESNPDDALLLEIRRELLAIKDILTGKGST